MTFYLAISCHLFRQILSCFAFLKLIMHLYALVRSLGKKQIVILWVESETNENIIVFSFSRPRETLYYFYDLA